MVTLGRKTAEPWARWTSMITAMMADCPMPWVFFRNLIVPRSPQHPPPSWRKSHDHVPPYLRIHGACGCFGVCCGVGIGERDEAIKMDGYEMKRYSFEENGMGRKILVENKYGDYCKFVDLEEIGFMTKAGDCLDINFDDDLSWRDGEKIYRVKRS